MSKSKVIGIAGGMGPKSGLLLFDYIMKHTKANRDQDHLPVILMSFPEQIQDRTEFLEGKVDQNPAYAIGKLITNLSQAGADVIGIPCNTSHTSTIFNVIEEELRHSNTRVQLLNMPLEVIHYLEKDYKQYQRIGVLSTNGTYHSQLYQKPLENAGFIPVVPDPEFQDQVVHRLIYDPDFGLKAHTERITEKAKEYVERIQAYFLERNAELLIFGCTELSMLYHMDMKIPFLDSTEVLAKALIREATTLEQMCPITY